MNGVNYYAQGMFITIYYSQCENFRIFAIAQILREIKFGQEFENMSFRHYKSA